MREARQETPVTPMPILGGIVTGTVQMTPMTDGTYAVIIFGGDRLIVRPVEGKSIVQQLRELFEQAVRGLGPILPGVPQ